MELKKKLDGDFAKMAAHQNREVESVAAVAAAIQRKKERDRKREVSSKEEKEKKPIVFLEEEQLDSQSLSVWEKVNYTFNSTNMHTLSNSLLIEHFNKLGELNDGQTSNRPFTTRVKFHDSPSQEVKSTIFILIQTPADCARETRVLLRHGYQKKWRVEHWRMFGQTLSEMYIQYKTQKERNKKKTKKQNLLRKYVQQAKQEEEEEEKEEIARQELVQAISVRVGEECEDKHDKEKKGEDEEDEKEDEWAMEEMEKEEEQEELESEEKEKEEVENEERGEKEKYRNRKKHICDWCSYQGNEGIVIFEEKVIYKCGTCKKVRYCNEICQSLDWDNHKEYCFKKS